MASLRATRPWLGVLLVLAASPVRAAPEAEAARVPAPLQAAILLKALKYEQRLGEAGGKLRIGVLRKRGDAASGAAQREMIESLGKLASASAPGVQGRGVQVLGLDERGYGAQPVDVLYLCPGLEQALAQVIAHTRKKQILTVTGEADLVARGAAMGIVVHAGKPQILIHLSAARAEGARFSSALLKIAKLR